MEVFVTVPSQMLGTFGPALCVKLKRCQANEMNSLQQRSNSLGKMIPN